MSNTKALSLVYGGHSEAGNKPRNEDAFTGILPTDYLRQGKGAVFCIADGVSCSENAQLASQTSATTFIQDYLSTPETWDVKTSASRVLGALNSWLHAQGQTTLARHNGFVTTFSAIILKSTTAHLLHCGDSRIYRLRDGVLVQYSEDHSMARTDGSLSLTRALGMDRDLKMDYQKRSLQVGDILMLTTDGVHDSLKHQELQVMLKPLSDDFLSYFGEGSNASLEKIARHIVTTALEAGSQDNLSCLIVKVLALPHGDLDEAHRKLTEKVIPPVLAPGNRIDEYTIVRVLHSGSRSHLYLATHPRYRHKFVLKMPSPNFADDAQYLEGFVREAWVGRRMDHPGIMKIHEPMSDTRFLYHCCEYIEGITLRQWIYDHPAPALQTVRELTLQITACLRAMQRLGMLHRDLKPDNIMITDSGEVKLIDFGTVLVSGLQDVNNPLNETVPVGTADYLAPEYLLGERGAFRSDIFSLGVIVYEMLTSALPYKALPTDISRINSYSHWQYRSARDVLPELPVWIDLCLQKACAPRPTQRYEALSEFMHDLQVPNSALLESHQRKPVLEQNPLLFWQLVSAALALGLLISLAF